MIDPISEEPVSYTLKEVKGRLAQENKKAGKPPVYRAMVRHEEGLASKLDSAIERRTGMHAQEAKWVVQMVMKTMKELSMADGKSYKLYTEEGGHIPILETRFDITGSFDGSEAKYDPARNGCQVKFLGLKGYDNIVRETPPRLAIQR